MWRQPNSPTKEQNKGIKMDNPLSQSYTSLRMNEIQKRFAELMDEEIPELHLEEPTPDELGADPYNRTR